MSANERVIRRRDPHVFYGGNRYRGDWMKQHSGLCVLVYPQRDGKSINCYDRNGVKLLGVGHIEPV